MCPVVRRTQHRRSPRLLFALRKARWLKSRRDTSEEARCRDERSVGYLTGWGSPA
jgi:hypothetical protein